MTTPLAPELRLAGRYTLEHRIAIGGMGEVWRARDEVLHRAVAVKVLKPEYAADPEFLTRFRNEARHTAALSHPGIASVFDYGEVDDTAYLVMEYVAGEPLSDVLNRDGWLQPARAMDVVGQAALALQAAHAAGVIHRDMKPGNILLRPDGVVKVTDFGIARAVSAVPLTQDGMLVGTAAYLSPEQATGQPAGPASDIYSLGVVAYECLAGERPFDADSAVSVAMAHLHQPVPPLPPDVPPAVGQFVNQALEKDPQRRPADAGDFGRTALALAASLRSPASGEVAGVGLVPTTPAPDGPTAGAASAESPPPGPQTRDDGHTKVLPVVPSGDGSAATPGDGEGAAGDDAHRRRVRHAFIGVGTGVVILGFLLLFLLGSGGGARGGGGPAYSTVPKVTGMAYRSAAAALARANLKANRSVIHDAAHAPGFVLRQTPGPGGRMVTGGTVSLTVASGPRMVAVNADNLVGQPVDTVKQTLENLNLQVSVNYQMTGDPPGTVVSVDPTGSVREGSTVTLTVAAQPAFPPGQDQQQQTFPPGPGRGHGHWHDH